jgi:hypothetical protein
VWLTVLGGALFFVAAMWWLTTLSAGPRGAGEAAAADGGVALAAPAHSASAH